MNVTLRKLKGNQRLHIFEANENGEHEFLDISEDYNQLVNEIVVQRRLLELQDQALREVEKENKALGNKVSQLCNAIQSFSKFKKDVTRIFRGKSRARSSTS